ncbi:hypothetical protein KP509_07G037200 [Ceratopteris richardii]|uniref:Uncharacterized protein n=1 Tax=Ceratopteris richardii TaxID=49495 RepID=A0A8T2UGW2_CERRI|nr:hypothetical protein KP509_07G037200 [Ceratopteris richardii]
MENVVHYGLNIVSCEQPLLMNARSFLSDGAIATIQYMPSRTCLLLLMISLCISSALFDSLIVHDQFQCQKKRKLRSFHLLNSTSNLPLSLLTFLSSGSTRKPPQINLAGSFPRYQPSTLSAPTTDDCFFYCRTAATSSYDMCALLLSDSSSAASLSENLFRAQSCPISEKEPSKPVFSSSCQKRTSAAELPKNVSTSLYCYV